MTPEQHVFFDIAGGPAYYVLHPQKGTTICFIFIRDLSKNNLPFSKNILPNVIKIKQHHTF